ncbi:hypothetical protein Ahy_B04g073324 [Arachis hypogaea]|uniref:Uncharacterized protein n=1 Tax=Arachis hypogaea TaxID=3818 RepID=A0A444ZQC4_ARAHY|nr:hypothetical protein Ahy_B04g073324 [Arachis hypogaea]
MEKASVLITKCIDSRAPSRSPTALGLPFRSSLFRELVEKNSNNACGDELDEEVTKDQQQNIASDDELGGIFCDGSDSISFFYDPNTNGLELQERNLYSIL